jgi:hypothetical protein
MALPRFEFSKEQQTPAFSEGGYTPSQVDPNLLRLLAERRRKQGLAGGVPQPGQRAPQPAQGLNIQQAPIDPRLRAAMMLRDRLRKQQQQQQAPTYGGVQPRNV